MNKLDLESLFSGAPAAGMVSLPLNMVVDRHPELAKAFESYEPLKLASTFGALLTVPELQGNCVRLEALVHLALAFGHGKRKPSSKFLITCFEELNKGPAGAMEDPTEDVFVSSIGTPRGNFRVLEGIWESAGFYLQRFVNVIDEMPRTAACDKIREGFYALLKLSDLVCERAELARWQLGNESPLQTLPRSISEMARSRRRLLSFSSAELLENGISASHLEEFTFDFDKREELTCQAFGQALLERFPLIKRVDEFCLVLPTAVSAALRRFAIQSAGGSNSRRALVTHLSKEYAATFSSTPLLGDGFGAPIQFQATKGGVLASTMKRVDVGRYINFVFLLDTLDGFEFDELAGRTPDPGCYAREVGALVGQAQEQAKQDPHFRDGITLIVGCGVGRGVAYYFDHDPVPQWRELHISAPDLWTLSWAEDTEPLSLWRLLDAQQRLGDLGVSLHNINGILNMVAWVRSLDGHLVPHHKLPDDFVTEGCDSFLVINQNSLRALRHEVSEGCDVHMEQQVDGRWKRVRRVGDSLFRRDSRRPLYAAEKLQGSNWLPAVYITEHRSWWCQIEVPKSTDVEGAYARWEMLTTWLPRIAPRLEASLPNLPVGPLLWAVHFEADFSMRSAVPERVSRSDAHAAIALEIGTSERTVTLHVGKKFDLAHFDATNIAELSLVERAVEGFALLCGEELSTANRDRIVAAIVTDTAARQTHAFRARSFRDLMKASVKSDLIEVNREDIATLRLGLGWRVRSRDEDRELNGKEPCMSFLNSVVRQLEDELCASLREFDRSEMIGVALLNHETAAQDRDRWQRTAGAVLALHEDRESTLDVIARHEFRLNAVFLATRVLVEIAVCECPLEGGRAPGKLDFSRLMAKSNVIAQLGGWSDAIRWDAMSPRVRVTTLGDIHVDQSFDAKVMQPFGRVASDTQTLEAVTNYAENLEEVRSRTPLEEVVEPEFLVAWEDEFGASLDDTLLLVDFLEERGIAAEIPIIEVQKADLLAAGVDGKSIAAIKARSLVEKMALKGRPSWREVPDGFEDKDRQPWRFRRRLSLLRRPLVQIDEGENSTFLVAPGLAREALSYMVAHYLHGDFPQGQLSSRMRSWRGRATDKRGTEFNQLVAARLREFGWQARSDLQISSILGKNYAIYGDIDVIAWTPTNSRMLLVECKDLLFGKTPGEMAEQLADFRGELLTNGKPDDLLRHLRRLDVMGQNLPQLSRYLNVPAPVVLEAHLVFRNPVPMQHAWNRMKDRVRLHIFDHLGDI